MPQSRQLAAIMFTDIVGYTALMGNDEKKVFELLSLNRAIQKPIIEKNNGKWIKEMGDGAMASFNTASDAVNAAMQIQKACNSTADFKLKIGMHLPPRLVSVKSKKPRCVSPRIGKSTTEKFSPLLVFQYQHLSSIVLCSRT